jgi:hypothetical protein
MAHARMAFAQTSIMKTRTLTVPELMFVIGTRAALAAGAALLVSGKLKPKTRRAAGLALMGVGGATTIPAARLFLRSGSLRRRLGL